MTAMAASSPPDLAPVAAQPREQMPFSHPDRPPMRFDLPKAWRHFRQFRKDIEKTSEVFRMFEALPWIGVVDTARRFLASDRGRMVFATEPFLPDILDDHEGLRRLPKGTFAHDYCDYMEKENLSAYGLVQEYEDFRDGRPRLDDQIEWYVDRLRDTHDLLHILTGFDRDALGEQCLGTYIFKQRASYGHLFLGYGGGLVIGRNVKSKAPVMRALYEARQIGKACPRIAEQPIRELLRMTTEEVRQHMRLRPARYYHEVHRVWRSEGVDPFKVLQKSAA